MATFRRLTFGFIIFIVIATSVADEIFHDDCSSFTQWIEPSEPTTSILQDGCVSGGCIAIKDNNILTSQPISTLGFKDIILEYSIQGMYLEDDINDYCQVFYSIDNGITWNLLHQYSYKINAHWQQNEQQSLPNLADNNQYIKIRFSTQKDYEDEDEFNQAYCYIDDISVLGTRIIIPPTYNPSLQPTQNPIPTPDNGIHIDIIFKYNITSNSTNDEIKLQVTNVTNNLLTETINKNNNDCYDTDSYDTNVALHNNSGEIDSIIEVCDANSTKQLISYLQQSSLETDLIERITIIDIVNGSTHITITDINDNESSSKEQENIYIHRYPSLYIWIIIVCIGFICCLCILCVFAVIRCRKLKKKRAVSDSMSTRHIRVNSSSEFDMNKDDDIITKGNDLVVLNSNKAFTTPKPPPRRNKHNEQQIQMNECNNNYEQKDALNLSDINHNEPINN